MIYCIGHFNVEDLYYPDFERIGTAGGACVYAAVAANMWSKEVSAISRIGKDYPESYLRQLEDLGIVLHLRKLDIPTMAGSTLYDLDGQRTFVMKNPKPHLELLTPDVLDIVKARITPCSTILIGPMALDIVQGIVDYLRAKKCFIAIDTCSSFILEDRNLFINIAERCDLFIPSREELEALYANDDTLEEKTHLASEELQCNVIVKDSVNGSFLKNGKGIIRIPCVDGVRVKDVTGAGDSFCGGVVAWLHDNPDQYLEAAICGTVSASYAIEDGGALHHTKLTKKDLHERFNRVKNTIQEAF